MEAYSETFLMYRIVDIDTSLKHLIYRTFSLVKEKEIIVLNHNRLETQTETIDLCITWLILYPLSNCY